MVALTKNQVFILIVLFVGLIWLAFVGIPVRTNYITTVYYCVECPAGHFYFAYGQPLVATYNQQPMLVDAGGGMISPEDPAYVKAFNISYPYNPDGHNMYSCLKAETHVSYLDVRSYIKYYQAKADYTWMLDHGFQPIECG